MHRGREQRRLAQRHGGEGERQSAGGQHAALHRLDQFRDGAVAVVEVRAGVDDADHRPVQHRLRIAHGFGERPAQIEREVAVAVVAVLRARPWARSVTGTLQDKERHAAPDAVQSATAARGISRRARPGRVAAIEPRYPPPAMLGPRHGAATWTEGPWTWPPAASPEAAAGRGSGPGSAGAYPGGRPGRRGAAAAGARGAAALVARQT